MLFRSQFSRSKAKLTMRNFYTRKRIKSELGLIFSSILRDDSKASKRQLQTFKMNILRQLEAKPIVKLKTKRILNEFECFLNELMLNFWDNIFLSSSGSVVISSKLSMRPWYIARKTCSARNAGSPASLTRILRSAME